MILDYIDIVLFYISTTTLLVPLILLRSIIDNGYIS
jgi:hypothetical protein